MPARSLVLALVAVAGLIALAVGIVAGAGRDEDSGAEPGAGTVEAGRANVSFLARILPPAVPVEGGPSVPSGVSGLMQRLPLRRKVSQMFLLGAPGAGSIEAGGLVVGAGDRVPRAGGRIRPLVMTRQDGGELNSFPGLPPDAAPADLASPREAAAGALASGRALRRRGVNGVLGPSVDVGLESGSPLGSRVYSDDPEEVARYAAAAVRAYRRVRVFSAVAHFPGLGGADRSTAEGPASVGLDLEDLRERDLVPFRAAIEAGTPGVLLSHALYPFSDFTVPASLSRVAATKLLRDELGFTGVAITDDLVDPAISALYPVPKAAVEAVRAGADMLWISGTARDQQAAYAAVLRAVRSGRIDRARVDGAVARILLAKRAYGLIG